MGTNRDDYSEWARDCYGDNFSTTLSPLTKRHTKGVCCYPGCRARAAVTHHAFYTKAKGPKGQRRNQDKPGRNLFPLCLSHHAIAHKPKNWKVTSRHPVTGRRNTPEFLTLLKRGYGAKRVRISAPRKLAKRKPRKSQGMWVFVGVAAIVACRALRNALALFFYLLRMLF